MAVDKSTFNRWAKRLASSEQGQGNVSELPCSGRPSTAVTPATMQRADSHIRNNRRITTRELAAILGIGKGSIYKIIHQLGYSKVCAWRVPRSLTEEHKEQRKIICSELLVRYKARWRFLASTVTGDETWIHHFEHEKNNPWSGIIWPLLRRKSLRQFPQPARSWQQSFGTVKGWFS
jgi:transposase